MNALYYSLLLGSSKKQKLLNLHFEKRGLQYRISNPDLHNKNLLKYGNCRNSEKL